jgi:hypothetical protein
LEFDVNAPALLPAADITPMSGTGGFKAGFRNTCGTRDRASEIQGSAGSLGAPAVARDIVILSSRHCHSFFETLSFFLFEF